MVPAIITPHCNDATLARQLVLLHHLQRERGTTCVWVASRRRLQPEPVTRMRESVDLARMAVTWTGSEELKSARALADEAPDGSSGSATVELDVYVNRTATGVQFFGTGSSDFFLSAEADDAGNVYGCGYFGLGPATTAQV